MGLTLTLCIAAQRDGHFAQPLGDLPDWCHVLIVVQRADAGIAAFQTGRVRQILDPGVGLSASRNRALAEAQTDLAVFVDDDMTVDIAGLRQVRSAFAADAGLAMVAGWRKEHLSRRKGGAKTQALGLFNAGRICAPELVVRVAAVRQGGCAFDPDFGLGGRHAVGEEYVFVTDVLKAGLKGVSLPVVLGSHPGASTGDRWDDPALLRARRAVLKRVFGRWAGFAYVAYGVRQRHRLGGWGAVAAFVKGR